MLRFSVDAVVAALAAEEVGGIVTGPVGPGIKVTGIAYVLTVSKFLEVFHTHFLVS